MDHITSIKYALSLHNAGFVRPILTRGQYIVCPNTAVGLMIYAPTATEILAQLPEKVSLYMYHEKWTCMSADFGLWCARNENPADAAAEMFLKFKDEANVAESRVS